MFSQTVEYALRAVACLAQRAPDSVSADDIAVVTKIPRAYLSKVLQQLRRSGVVICNRGVNGGNRLAIPPEQLTILTIVDAVEPIKRIERCPLELAAHGVQLCPLHRRMDNAIGEVRRALAESTLAEMLSEPSESIPLCPFPAIKGGLKKMTERCPKEVPQ
jgi:Rrf2 family transcriptional regulator, nitric oxide-sensitive transcriptional repressor